MLYWEQYLEEWEEKRFNKWLFEEIKKIEARVEALERYYFPEKFVITEKKKVAAVEVATRKKVEEENQRFEKDESEKSSVEVQCCSPMMKISRKKSHVVAAHSNIDERKKGKDTRKEWRKKKEIKNTKTIFEEVIEEMKMGKDESYVLCTNITLNVGR